AVPPRIDELFKAGRYVPYTALSASARLKASQGEEEVTFNVATGSFATKSVDRRNEKSIQLVDWIGAARIAEERTRHYHGQRRADALGAHHKLVTDIGRVHGWETAVEYDVQQRDLAALNPFHDLSGVDITALTVISTAQLILSLPPGCQAATFDISAAYRLTPIRPEQQNSLCLRWEGLVYVDRA
ncbi:hypothetical protein B0H16DRAFT_1274192, partial [Mycena metata]